MSSVLRTFFGDYSRPIAEAPHRPAPTSWHAGELSASWLGHATVLINFFGLTILTDPVFFARVGIRAGPLTIGPKRYVRCALEPRALPPIDLVLLSHAHMDHMDLRSIRRLRRAGTIITAHKTADVFGGNRKRNVHEIGWSETRRVETSAGAVTIKAFRLRHWGARMRWDDFRTYNAYVLERNGVRLGFAGDTAYTSAAALGEDGPIDLLLMPIGAYYPWVSSHCNPEEAVQMANEVSARFIMPIHHQTFQLSYEPMMEPIARFKAALENEERRIALTEIGQTFVLPS